MRTVKIPSWNNPFVVTVNGEKYSYPGGSTVEVPDEVAEMIENIIANMPAESENYSTNEVVDFGGKKLRNIASPVVNGDAVNKGYLDNRLSGKESLPNKVSSISGSEKSTTKYPSVKAMTDYVETDVAERMIYFPEMLEKDGQAVSSLGCATQGSKMFAALSVTLSDVNFSVASDNKVSFVDFGEDVSLADASALVASLSGYEADLGEKTSFLNEQVMLHQWFFSFEDAASASAAAAAVNAVLPQKCTILIKPIKTITAEIKQ